jgi:hypothetical protein
MTNGVDEHFERTAQVQWVVGDSNLVAAAGPAVVRLGTVPAGQSWLVERLAIRYRPGLAPTDPYVPFRLCANDVGPADSRDGTELRPTQGWAAGGRYNFFADEASPVRFFPGETLIATAPLYADATHKGRLEVNVQVRAVVPIPGATTPDTEGVPETPIGHEDPPHEPAWN